MKRFSKLFETTTIGHMKLRNRIVMSAMGTNLGAEDGFVTARIKDYFEARARGGVGMVIVEGACPEIRYGRATKYQTDISDDRFIPGLSELAEVVKRHGARAAIQLHHGGRLGKAKELVAASPIPVPHYPVPRELTREEIADIVSLFGQAAARARQAGFEGIEIHGAHDYLIANFLSAATNKRDDEYGGGLENRARLLLEIVSVIRRAVGRDYPVWCRIDGSQYGLQGGTTLDEACSVARMVEKAGLDALHVSAFGVGRYSHLGPPTLVPGSMLPLAEAVKKVVSIPVITVGRISPELAERTLREGKADLIAMGRPLIADPELPNKLASGRQEDITPCIACLHCLTRTLDDKGVQCSANPAVGREGELRMERAEKPKRVLVIGGGPAGIQAARVAAQRGHRVVLCDKDRRLGGAMTLAAIVNEDLESLADYLRREVKRLPIEVRLGEEVTPQLVERLAAEAIVVATGGGAISPQIAGAARDNVLGVEEMRALLSGRLEQTKLNRKPFWRLASLFLRWYYKPSLIRWLLKSVAPLGKRVVIVGGSMPGFELGLFLAKRGKSVTIVEESKAVGAGLNAIVSRWFRGQILDRGGTILTETKAEEITPGGLVISRNGQRETIPANTIFLALGLKPDPHVVQALEGKGAAIYPIGDCAEPGTLFGAIESGLLAGHTL